MVDVILPDLSMSVGVSQPAGRGTAQVQANHEEATKRGLINAKDSRKAETVAHLN